MMKYKNYLKAPVLLLVLILLSYLPTSSQGTNEKEYVTVEVVLSTSKRDPGAITVTYSDGTQKVKELEYINPMGIQSLIETRSMKTKEVLQTINELAAKGYSLVNSNMYGTIELYIMER